MRIYKIHGNKKPVDFFGKCGYNNIGYKIILGEKHTTQRDLILRLCFGGKFSLEETQRALKLYGMAPLYSKIPRDAVLMIAFNTKMTDVFEVNGLLSKYEMEELFQCTI